LVLFFKKEHLAFFSRSAGKMHQRAAGQVHLSPVRRLAEFGDHVAEMEEEHRHLSRAASCPAAVSFLSTTGIAVACFG
jgi:hypothetical protein